MKLKSLDFQHKGKIPTECTCDGEDLSPQLSWGDFPKETKSFLIDCVDKSLPEADWVHWIVVNLPSEINELEQGTSLRKGGFLVENDFGCTEYKGPCPAVKEHRYIFTVYALDIEKLINVHRRDYLKQIEKHILGQASLEGLYIRQIF